MADYEIGRHVAHQKRRNNILDWTEGDGEVELEEYLQILMESEETETTRFLHLQLIGLELGLQDGEEAEADALYERILEADEDSGDQVFSLSAEEAERAFYEEGYNAAVERKKYSEE